MISIYYKCNGKIFETFSEAQAYEKKTKEYTLYNHRGEIVDSVSLLIDSVFVSNSYALETFIKDYQTETGKKLYFDLIPVEKYGIKSCLFPKVFVIYVIKKDAAYFASDLFIDRMYECLEKSNKEE